MFIGGSSAKAGSPGDLGAACSSGSSRLSLSLDLGPARTYVPSGDPGQVATDNQDLVWATIDAIDAGFARR